jgi:hypothetical protein
MGDYGWSVFLKKTAAYKRRGDRAEDLIIA